MDILRERLKNQGLLNSSFLNAKELVSYLGAVQAQDFAASKWSLGVRINSSTDESISKSFNEGDFLRTHIMRPTWHFVSPENISWMQKLTSGRVKQLMNHYNKKLELTGEVFKKTNSLITKWLRDKNYLTRQEIKELLGNVGIKTNVQRLAHIVMWAELDALICSGPLRDKQHTYALLSERTKDKKQMTKDHSLAELAKLYFQSHGPALIKDFSWWSGLTMKDAALGVELNKSKLFSEEVNGNKYWFFGPYLTTHYLLPTTHLLSVYDEYFIGYKDRSLILNEGYQSQMAAVGNALLTSLIIINGKVEGTWKRKIIKDKVEIKLNLFRKLSPNEKPTLKTAFEDYGKFLGMNAVLL